MTRIGFIGAGRMAEALIARVGSAHRIIASDISSKRLSYLAKKYKIKKAKSNREVFKAAQIIILAVKPQNISEVLREGPGASDWGKGKLIVSIAAGIPLSYLQKKLPGLPIVRAMPNNPALVGMGITALAKGKKASRAQYKKAAAIFKAVGEVVEVKEKLMDAVTGLSGSGPAYIYQAIEALAYGGVAAGLPRKVAAELALITVLGAAYTVLNTGRSPVELREMVASPGGTTVEGLKVLKRNKFSGALIAAVTAAARKSAVLSKRWTS